MLKSTQPGRSDHKLLAGAVSKLEDLLAMLSERENLTVGNAEDTARNQNSLNSDQDNRYPESQPDRLPSKVTGSETTDEQGRTSVGSSVHPSSISSGSVMCCSFMHLTNFGPTVQEGLPTQPQILHLVLHLLPPCQCLFLIWKDVYLRIAY